ncbi:hypothetical protein AB0M28_31360 [Streptomyces sp. NPDC051940]|uniref:hypothetical protein n=1 Tax=Streptomyces sp. NPDC051940 TaxID=3155675 RepID=UPI003436D20B
MQDPQPRLGPLLADWRRHRNSTIARHLDTPWRLSLCATVYRTVDPHHCAL